MPSFQDSAVIFILALLLFGPKKLPELARQLGKLMGEFRRASAEFRMQMEDELRVSEQAERQKQIAAIEAAAPVAPAISSSDPTLLPPPEPAHVPGYDTEAKYPDTPAIADTASTPGTASTTGTASAASTASATAQPVPLPIATSGSLNLMPPATGLPIERSPAAQAAAPELSSAAIFASVPPAPDRTRDSLVTQHSGLAPFSDSLPAEPQTRPNGHMESSAMPTPDPVDQPHETSTHG